jgi:hypothetical protein
MTNLAATQDLTIAVLEEGLKVQVMEARKRLLDYKDDIFLSSDTKPML